MSGEERGGVGIRAVGVDRSIGVQVFTILNANPIHELQVDLLLSPENWICWWRENLKDTGCLEKYVYYE